MDQFTFRISFTSFGWIDQFPLSIHCFPLTTGHISSLQVILTCNTCHSPHTPFVPYSCNSLPVTPSFVGVTLLSSPLLSSPLLSPEAQISPNPTNIQNSERDSLSSDFCSNRRKGTRTRKQTSSPVYWAMPFTLNSACILQESSPSDIIAPSSAVPRALFAIFLIIFCIMVFLCMSYSAYIVMSSRVEMLCYLSLSP